MSTIDRFRTSASHPPPPAGPVVVLPPPRPPGVLVLRRHAALPLQLPRELHGGGAAATAATEPCLG